jgi:hypothetical protein
MELKLLGFEIVVCIGWWIWLVIYLHIFLLTIIITMKITFPIDLDPMHQIAD